MIIIVDYGMGNLRSVLKAFERQGVRAAISNEQDEIERASKLVLPGVGHFKKGMENLTKLNLVDSLNKKANIEKTPILGICLGMQLMTKFSEEGQAPGLGWLNATTRKISFTQSELKIPHMGWNNLQVRRNTGILKGINQDDYFYFVHSYYVSCDQQEDIVAESTYGQCFVSSFQHEHIYGCQFHPEKSHDAGLKILKNFAEVT
ncbi:MAG: imidazole glycerol phosphate synthase subunit HisH [Candidatus Atribacteria bacterium]|nr:imidazole glycerol phosphate synthase subunit HisH [Candidatus Atribacteria bacterium]